MAKAAPGRNFQDTWERRARKEEVPRRCPEMVVMWQDKNKEKLVSRQLKKETVWVGRDGQKTKYSRTLVCRSRLRPARESQLLNFQGFCEPVIIHSHYLRFSGVCLQLNKLCFKKKHTKVINTPPASLPNYFTLLCSCWLYLKGRSALWHVSVLPLCPPLSSVTSHP